MSLSSPRRSVVLFGLLAFSSVVATGACGSDETTPPPSTPDGGGGVPDSSAPDTSKPDTGGGNDSGVDTGVDTGVDAGADVAVQTNESEWLASSAVLPSAACTPWELVDTAAAKDPVLSAGFVTLATDPEAEKMFYHQPAADLITPALLVIEARLRVVAGSASDASRAPAAILARYGNPVRTVAFYLSTTEVFLNTGDQTKGNAATVATTDAPHTYRIEVNTTTHAVEVKRDTVSAVTGTAYLEPDGAAGPVILWGEASILATGSSEWVSFTHNAHATTTCP